MSCWPVGHSWYYWPIAINFNPAISSLQSRELRFGLLKYWLYFCPCRLIRFGKEGMWTFALAYARTPPIWKTSNFVCTHEMKVVGDYLTLGRVGLALVPCWCLWIIDEKKLKFIASDHYQNLYLLYLLQFVYIRIGGAGKHWSILNSVWSISAIRCEQMIKWLWSFGLQSLSENLITQLTPNLVYTHAGQIHRDILILVCDHPIFKLWNRWKLYFPTIIWATDYPINFKHDRYNNRVIWCSWFASERRWSNLGPSDGRKKT